MGDNVRPQAAECLQRSGWTMLETLRGIPKVQLHVHLEGTLTPELLLALAHRHGVDLGARKDLGPDDLYRFKDFQEFLYVFQLVCRALRDPEDYGVLAAGYARTAAEQGVRYAEVFISPSVWMYFHRGFDVRAAVKEIREAFDAERAHSGFEGRLIADVTRNFGLESAMETVKLAAALMDFGVIGIGLGGDEARFPARDFRDAFAYARSLGLHTVAHAGEAEAAWSIRDAVQIGAERIGHGCTAVGDPDVVSMLAERGICVEACPSSNELTGVWKKGEPHPLVALDAAGVPIAIDADDPMLFSTTLLNEYERVEQMVGLAGIHRFARNAVVHSFADEVTKRGLLAGTGESLSMEKQ